MRTKPVQTLILSLLICSTVWRIASAQQPPGTLVAGLNKSKDQVRSTSLLPNGDFEQADPSGEWPEGWGAKMPGNGITWETENGHRFMRLVSQQSGQLQTLYRSINLPLGKVRAVKASIRYRASGIEPGVKQDDDARLLVAFEDATGRTLDTHLTPLRFEPATAWKEVSGQTLVPERATRCTVVAGLIHAAAGTVDVGEIAVSPLDAVATEALAVAPTEQPISPSSWVQNGSFDRPNADGNWPADWGKPNPGMTWQTEENGHFVRVAQEHPGQELWLYKTVPLQTGAKGIELLIRWRAEGVQYGEHEWFDARTIVHFQGADGQQLPTPEGDVVFTHKPEPTGWQEAVRSYMVPQGATALQLMAGLFRARAGTLDLAEIRVTPMNDATAELQAITGAAYGIWKGYEDAARDRQTGAEIDAQLAATGNLVPNGGFEEIDKSGNPVAWGKQHTEGITWQEENGDHFMRLTSQDPQKVCMLYRMVPLKLGMNGIEIKVRYRTANITKGDRSPGDARIVMHYLTGMRWGHLEYGREVTPQPEDIELSPAAQAWTEVTRRFLVPEGATKLQFMPGLWKVAAGTLDISDIHIAPVSVADTKPTTADVQHAQ